MYYIFQQTVIGFVIKDTILPDFYRVYSALNCHTRSFGPIKDSGISYKILTIRELPRFKIITQIVKSDKAFS